MTLCWKYSFDFGDSADRSSSILILFLPQEKLKLHLHYFNLDSINTFPYEKR